MGNVRELLAVHKTEESALLSLGATDVAQVYLPWPAQAESRRPRPVPLGCSRETPAHGLSRLTFGFGWRYPTQPKACGCRRLALIGDSSRGDWPSRVTFELFSALSGGPELCLLSIHIEMKQNASFDRVLTPDEMLRVSRGREWALPILPALKGTLYIVSHRDSPNERRINFVLEGRKLPDWIGRQYRAWRVADSRSYIHARNFAHALNGQFAAERLAAAELARKDELAAPYEVALT